MYNNETDCFPVNHRKEPFLLTLNENWLVIYSHAKSHSTPLMNVIEETAEYKFMLRQTLWKVINNGMIRL